MAATGYLLTAFLIWAVLTALGTVHVEEPSAPLPRARRNRASRAYSRRVRARESAPSVVAGALNVVVSPGE